MDYEGIPAAPAAVKRACSFSGGAVASLLRSNPFSVLISCALAAVLGVLGVAAYESWAYDEAPVTILKSHATLSADGRWLITRLDQDPRCANITVYQLYPADEEATREVERNYVGIGSSMNGLPFPGSVPRYTLRFAIPPGLSGDYLYVERGRNECPPFFWSRYSYTTTPPLRFHLGP